MSRASHHGGLCGVCACGAVRNASPGIVQVGCRLCRMRGPQVCTAPGARAPEPACARPSAWRPPDTPRRRAAAAGGALAAARAQQALPAALRGPGGARAGRPLPGPHRRALLPAAVLARCCRRLAWDPPLPCAWAARPNCAAFGSVMDSLWRNLKIDALRWLGCAFMWVAWYGNASTLVFSKTFFAFPNSLYDHGLC